MGEFSFQNAKELLGKRQSVPRAWRSALARYGDRLAGRRALTGAGMLVEHATLYSVQWATIPCTFQVSVVFHRAVSSPKRVLAERVPYHARAKPRTTMVVGHSREGPMRQMTLLVSLEIAADRRPSNRRGVSGSCERSKR